MVPAIKNSLNVQSEDKKTMKTAFDHMSTPASRNFEPDSNSLGSCKSKRNISATILSLDNGQFVGCEVVGRGRLAPLRMLFCSKSNFDRC